jgi:hypothetical protein
VPGYGPAAGDLLAAELRTVECRCSQFDVLHHIANAPLADAFGGDGFRLIARHGRDFADAEAAAVMIPDDTPGTATVRAVVGGDASDLPGVQVRSRSAWAEVVLSAGDPLPVGSTTAGSDLDDCCTSLRSMVSASSPGEPPRPSRVDCPFPFR